MDWERNGAGIWNRRTREAGLLEAQTTSNGSNARLTTQTTLENTEKVIPLTHHKKKIIAETEK